MPPDPEELHCETCDCTFQVGIWDDSDLEVCYCPFCGEPLDADEL